jgi:NADPH-dependent 2,4-dienoyl-CoA reductase/sulfur reductase-like enzyme
MVRSIYDSVIVGAGFAGLTAARRISEARPEAAVLHVNGEQCLPYKRTKVSKSIARGYALDDFALIGEDGIKGIDIVKKTVAAVTPARQTVTFTDNASAQWKTLVIATGAKPRRLFSCATPVVRTAADGISVRRMCEDAKTVAVIGGGVLGVELCEQMVLLGKRVTLFVRGSAIMPNDFNDYCSRWLGALLSRQGVDCRFNCDIHGITRTDAHYQVRLNESREVFDVVIECTGSYPDTAVAQTAGVEIDTGIRVNGFLQTSHPNIFAAGDCCQVDGFVPHLWHQAEDTATVAGANAVAILQNKPLLKYDYRPRRLKCEVFGAYLFSLDPRAHARAEEFRTSVAGDIYRQFGFTDKKLCSVMMIGDEAHAKVFETAVRDGVGPDCLHEYL